jgi:predicted aspartyl protease
MFMTASRIGTLLSASLALAALVTAAAATAEKASKPRPAPDTPTTLPPLKPAIIDDTVEIAGEDVKARKEETRLTVEVQVNGQGPYHFIVDSGADTTAIGLRTANQLQLPLGRPATLNAMTARNIVDRVKVKELKLGSHKIENLELAALNENDIGGDGMIGIDALVSQRLMMDFEKRLIRVEDGRKKYVPQPGEIVVTAYRRKGQLILTRVKAAGLPLDAVIDTGTEISIGNLALRDKLIKGNRDKFVTIPVTGVTGETIDVQLARVSELRLGSVILRDVPIAFADLPPFEVFGLSKGPALLLGTDLLETFRRVSLDFHGRKVRFQLKRCESTAIMLSTTTKAPSRLSSDNPQVCQR